jgi:hypothetical protein
VNRHITSRVLLSSLLLWQLVAGAFVHAHGVAAMDMQSAVLVSANPAQVLEEHCADHASMSMDMTADIHAYMSMDEVVPEQHDDSQFDCCQSIQCNCPCINAAALPLSLPYVPTARPDALLAQAVAIPLLDTGISGQFRPPI